MRPLKSHFPAHALTTLDTLLKQTKEVRVFRRAQAVREVVTGQHINTVAATFRFTNAALRAIIWYGLKAFYRLAATHCDCTVANINDTCGGDGAVGTSISITSAMITARLSSCANTERRGSAISPGDTLPVAT